MHQVGDSEGVDCAGAGRGGAGDAPERPGDGVEERGLAVAVVPAEAGNVDALEVQGRHVVAVAHEVVDAESEGDQWWRLAGLMIRLLMG